MSHIILILLVYLTLIDPISTKAQEASAHIQGIVRDQTQNPIPGATVLLKIAQKGAYTDSDGRYSLTHLPSGTDTLIISCVGFKSQSFSIRLQNGQTIQNVTLQEEIIQNQEMIVEAKSVAEEVRETGYAVSVIESAPQKNLTTDVNQVLKTTPGIHLRESGGLGSGFKLSLNGLSGNQIRYFINGMPMENFGTALSLSNYPVNLIDRLEVYKGAVPISLGADALGGAINIVTDHHQKSFLDATLSTGSFGTQRGSVNTQYANNKTGYFLKLSSFANHSKNTYWMHNMPVYDLELGNLLGTIRTKRFHDTYTSKMLHTEVGLFEKFYADKISISLITASNRKNYQHPDNNLKRIFGRFHTTSQTVLLASTYQKEIQNLRIKGFAIVGKTQQSVIDTSVRKYNWAGDYVVREPNDPKGELFERRSHRTLSDRMIRSNMGAGYIHSEKHTFSINVTQNYLKRTGNDRVNTFNRAFESPNDIHKSLLGISYTHTRFNKRLSATTFGKQYWFSGKIITQDLNNNDVVTQPKLSQTGYGLAISYHIRENLRLKTSYEKAYRIPESFEILGDGIYVTPNPNLAPERSHNINLGIQHAHQAHNINVKTQTNFFYRNSKAFIRFNPLGPFGEYENLNNVRTIGLETSLNTSWHQLLSYNINLTYEHLTDQTQFDEGLPNTNYKSRIPNTPYFFGNMRLGISPSSTTSHHKIRAFWHMRYIHAFFLSWENLGNKENKHVIPRQITHDLQLEYAAKESTYNITLSVNNVTDAHVYDNFNIQKPGRSINTKLRFFLR